MNTIIIWFLLTTCFDGQSNTTYRVFNSYAEALAGSTSIKEGCVSEIYEATLKKINEEEK